jgi:hypothetical protein
MQRQSDLTADELNKLKDEIDNERRKTLAEKDNLLKALKSAEGEKENLNKRIRNGDV